MPDNDRRDVDEEERGLAQTTLLNLLKYLEIVYEAKEKDYIVITLPRAQIKALVILYGPRSSDEGEATSVQLRASFSGYQNFQFKHANSWNRKKRFAKAYLDEDSDPILEADAVVDSHQSAHLKRLIELYDQAATDFLNLLKVVDSGVLE